MKLELNFIGRDPYLLNDFLYWLSVLVEDDVTVAVIEISAELLLLADILELPDVTLLFPLKLVKSIQLSVRVLKGCVEH